MISLGIELNPELYRKLFEKEIHRKKPNLDLLRTILESGLIDLKLEVDNKGNTYFDNELAQKGQSLDLIKFTSRIWSEH